MNIVIILTMGFWKNVDSELEFQSKSRKELAAAIGFDVTCISIGIKRDNTPAADTALKIAHALNVPLESLLGMEVKSSQKKFENEYVFEDILSEDFKKQVIIFKKYENLIENLEKLNSKSLHLIENLAENMVELSEK